MKKPHVVYILTKLELGGAQKICLALLDGVLKQGVGASLISGSQGKLVSVIKKYDSVFLIDSLKREIGFKSILLEFKAFFKIIGYLRRLKKEHGDLVVHTHSTKAGIVGRWAAVFAGIKRRIHTVHGFGFNDYQPWLKWTAIYLFEFVTCLITTHYVCVSSEDVRIGTKILPWFRKKSSIIRAAVEWDKFYTPAIVSGGNEKFTFGSVSCFKPQKNLFDLLEAFKLVRKQVECGLEIAGDGAMRLDLENWISNNNMERDIKLLGWKKDVASVMKNWDAYVMSSLWEGLPCAIVEARLLKLPVVAYSVGGISDVIVDHKNGFLVPPKMVELLAKKMILIAKDSGLYQNMKTYQEDLSAFSNKFMVKEHLSLYNRLF